jgi:hypothetical protein
VARCCNWPPVTSGVHQRPIMSLHRHDAVRGSAACHAAFPVVPGPSHMAAEDGTGPACKPHRVRCASDGHRGEWPSLAQRSSACGLPTNNRAQTRHTQHDDGKHGSISSALNCMCCVRSTFSTECPPLPHGHARAIDTNGLQVTQQVCIGGPHGSSQHIPGSAALVAHPHPHIN